MSSTSSKNMTHAAYAGHAGQPCLDHVLKYARGISQLRTLQING